MTIPHGRPGRHNENWRRVSQRRPCPVCEKPDWCLYAGPESDPTAAICARVESPRRCGEAGWLHRLRDDDWQPTPNRTHRLVLDTSRNKPNAERDWQRLANECEASLADVRLDGLANSLGVSADSLRQLRVGWSSEHAAYTFPMCDAVGRVLGVRLRGSDGHKWSVRGGQEGLFLPRTGETANSGMLLVCEGPTDAAALIDLGFYTIGRPSCTGGVRLIVELVQSLRPDCVTILADADAPGIRGANNLAVLLTAYVPSVRVVIPPPGIKDARQWKRRGATHGDVLRRIEMVEPRRLGIVVKGGVR